MGALALKQSYVAPSSAKTHDDDIAAMVIGGEIVMIDTADFSVDGTSLCAVILWDGSIDLQYPKLAHERSYLGKRTGFFGKGERAANGSVHLYGCTILGKVVSHA